MKIVIESKSKVSLNTPPKWKLSVQIWVQIQIWGVPESPLKMKIVIESKYEVSQNTPPKWKLS